jgi:FMN-dependent NADH-azoreductase
MILAVTFLPRPESRTKQLYEEFRCALLEGAASPSLRERELARDPESPLSVETLGTRAAQPTSAAHSLVDAQGLVLAFPVWNFATPAQVKTWIDAVVVPGLTYTFDAQGLRSALQGRPVQLVTTAGGSYEGSFFPALPLERLFGGFLGMDWRPPVVATEQDLPNGPERLLAARALAVAAAADFHTRLTAAALPRQRGTA